MNGPDPDPGSGGAIERFFAALSGRDWESLARELAPDVERVGPFGDRVTGRARYLDLLRGLVPSDYGNDVRRVVYAPDGRSGFARVTEHLGYPDRTLTLEEAYLFGMEEHGLISRVEIFWQTPDADPGGFGSAASEESYAARERPGPDERPPNG